MVRTSPLAAPWFSPRAVSSSSVKSTRSRLRSARSASALSTSSAGTLATWRVSANVEKSGIAMSGRISISSLNSRSAAGPGAVGSAVTTSSFGETAGRSARSDINCWVDSLISCSRISAAMAPPYRCFTIGIGTLPGRKPGRLTCFASSESRDARRRSMSAAGTTTAYARLRPSERVSVTCICQSVLYIYVRREPVLNDRDGAGGGT